MNHTDGPWGVYPFCGLYRCMLSINDNEMIRTRFPFAGKEFTLSNGDVAGFDFNREIHDIYNNPDTFTSPFTHPCVRASPRLPPVVLNR
jgi:hypothetical protein